MGASNVEDILQNILDGTTEYKKPYSRVEILLVQIKDLIAQLQSAVNLKGETTTPLTDNATTNPIMIDGESYTAVMNDAVIYQSGEFIFDGSKWHELGDLSNLASVNIGAMTGYAKASTASAIATTDTLNQAIGKVEKRVDVNENNILLNNNALCQIINTDSKNMLKLNRDRVKALNANGTWVDYTFTPTAQPNLHITINDDFSITYTGTSSGDFSFAIYAGTLPDLQGYVLSGTTNYNNNYILLQKSTAPYTVIARDEGNGAIISEYSNTENLTLNVTIRAQATDIETTMSPMICKKDYWDITKTYAPYNYIPDYTTCYSMTSNDGTFAAILANATQSKGVSGVISYIASIYTATSNEYLLLYGLFSLNTLHNCVKIVNNTINFVAVNNGGTIAVSGGTGAYTAKIKLLI